MSSEIRKQKKEVRKLERKERKAIFNKLLAAAIAVKDMQLIEGLSYKEKIARVWSVVKPTLEFAIILKITGEKFDTAANKLIIIGNNITGNETTDQQAIEFLNTLSSAWNTIEMALEVIKIAAPDDKDEDIDKIIEIGEWLFENSKS
ncbi:MAG TPA: hypothetical protein DDX39_02200 [Bacteroidales bacterium]|nr:MAG: hypothetical protein A2W98_08820 [Bacteroidetes bacterium GWF2_33_38]OFY73846.1 MAG: hypothetical protein A2265_02550 [Bacteroidetes bacterium RIFOXYA12_FULL_33_9]OFY84987.1 MAG: hypothetical protein A2236_03205 [Bacteroidetes bacterium RIFOXYA2_FULL_33_7]HBF87426.1 hypothetical protein [Bacteroidales bacterium]